MLQLFSLWMFHYHMTPSKDFWMSRVWRLNHTCVPDTDTRGQCAPFFAGSSVILWASEDLNVVARGFILRVNSNHVNIKNHNMSLKQVERWCVFVSIYIYCAEVVSVWPELQVVRRFDPMTNHFTLIIWISRQMFTALSVAPFTLAVYKSTYLFSVGNIFQLWQPQFVWCPCYQATLVTTTAMQLVAFGTTVYLFICI